MLLRGILTGLPPSPFEQAKVFLATKSIARAKSYGKDTPGRTPYGSMARDSLSGFLDCALLILSGNKNF
jgi:hypothetical protein